MNYEDYRNAHFADPIPEPRFCFSGSAITLYFEKYEVATDYYERVLGPPAYVEGEGTKGWQIGSDWLTLLRGKSGSPKNIELTFRMETPLDAEKLQQAFIEAGGQGTDPSDQLMYEPVRLYPVCDPFGTEILIIASIDRIKNTV